MGKHTNGPWSIGFGGMDGDDSAAITSPHSEYAICNLEPRGYVQANAKLIAAAPTLVTALELIVKSIALAGEPELARDQYCLGIARAAIAKATS